MESASRSSRHLSPTSTGGARAAGTAGSPGGMEMFVVWAVMVPLIASSYLAGYLKRRRTRQAEGDWSFLRNRRALFGGTAAALLPGRILRWCKVYDQDLL